MKQIFWGLLLFVFFLGAAAETRIVLYVGQQRTLSVSGADQIAIAGKGQIATGSLLNGGKSIVITANAPGTVSMTVSYLDGHKEEKTIRVLSREREQAMLEFEKIGPLFNDIQIIPVGDNIGLLGKIYSIEENNYLNAFLERYPEIINLMEDKRGDVLLQMEVQIVEINLSGAQDLGIEWISKSSNTVNFPQGLDYGEVANSRGSMVIGEEYVPRRLLPSPQYAVGPLARLSPFTAKINFLVEKGTAKVLARPKLVCKSGESAEFLVGGEFPVRIATPEKAQIDWKQYGTRLKVNPVLVKMGSNEVDVSILVEISDVDWTNQVEGYPGVTRRSVSTVLKLAESNAVAIAGLLSVRKSRVQSRVPFLGAIPFLGRLFSSTRDEEKEMETVILITPKILPVKNETLNIPIEHKELKKAVQPEEKKKE